MATTAAERAALAAALVAAAVALAASCATPVGPGAPGPSPATVEPLVQVGLVVGAAGVTLGGDSELILSHPDGSRVLAVPAGEVWRATAAEDGIALTGASGAQAGRVEQVRVAPGDSGATVRLNGRSYRGVLILFRDRTGLTAVNQVPLEAYLLGVVSGEMGRRDPSEREALRAQAVVSRTYALRNLGRWRSQGFDLYPTVTDQVYGGTASEAPEGREAVASTRGQVLTYGGQPIDAFFFSTCGGRTADGTEVFGGASRPYLRSVADLSPEGVVYCGISPRFRWREEWTGDQLRGVLRQSLPAVLGISTGRVTEVRDVRIGSHTGSGRVAQLSIGLGADDAVLVDGPSIRQVLRTRSGDILRSTSFALQVSRDGRRVVRMAAEGGGNGHGVGFCQWGAVGRARAGQDYQRILEAYYGGTELRRLY